SSQGLLSIEAIVPLVMGAHIGGTMTTLISSLGAEKIDAKRVALANTIYRVFAAILLFPFFPYFARLIEWSSDELPRQVANTHLFSAIFMVIIFLPFNGFLAKMLMKIVPKRKGGDKEFSPKYISKSALELPVVALTQANQEVRWLAHNILENMFQLIPRVFSEKSLKWSAIIEKSEEEVYWCYGQIINYITLLLRKSMTRQQIIECNDIQFIAKELEYMADKIVVMSQYGNKMQEEKISFNEKDWDIFQELYMMVSGNYLALVNALDSRDRQKIEEVISTHPEVMKVHNKLQINIMTGLPECDKVKIDNFENKNVLIDIVNGLFTIAEHIINIAKVMRK
ncbi:MAG: Na/Pi cotransporter family protein, partial [Eubacteriales bacterium]